MSATLVFPGFGLTPTPGPVLQGDPDGLRPYQREAAEAIHAKLCEYKSTLLVMATGTGKTQTFGAVAKHWDGKVLILAHRDELIGQAQRRMAQMTGELVDIEQAQLRSEGTRIVVGSVQTMCKAGRLKRFGADAFSLIIIDEAHHAPGDSYKRIIEHFSGGKLLGVTATPDRLDKRAMGLVFDSLAYTYTVRQGIEGGYLCPISITQVHVGAINLAAVRTVAGDLNQGDLDAVMSAEEALHGVAKPLVEHAGDRPTIVFTTSVENAHRMAEVINRYRPNSAKAVDGTTDSDLRRQMMKGLGKDFQFLVNVGVATEGVDIPAVSCIAMARPTKSRSLYSQCVGRGLRIFPGKEDCRILDFCGNAGKHSLVCGLDALGGNYDEPTMAKAKEILADAKEPMLAEEALAKAQEAIEKARLAEAARRVAIKANVQYRLKALDPWSVFHVDAPPSWGGSGFGQKLASEAQIGVLIRANVPVPPNCTAAQASKLVGTIIKRRELGLASFGQLKMLRKYGVDTVNISFPKASALIDAIVKNNYHRPGDSVIASILGRTREIGEEG